MQWPCLSNGQGRRVNMSACVVRSITHMNMGRTYTHYIQMSLLQAVLQTVKDFQGQAKALISDRDWRRDSPAPDQLQALLDQGDGLPVLVPECDMLKGQQEQASWLSEVRRTLGAEAGERGEVTLVMLRSLMEAGCGVSQSVSVETAMAELQELLTIAERWEEKAQICLEQR